jgi:hypothetical protein
MVHAIFYKTRAKIDPRVRKDFDQAIGSLDAYSGIKGVDDITRMIAQWVEQHPHQADTINDVVIRNHDIYQAYQKLGGK